jgi:hypothetical protein
VTALLRAQIPQDSESAANILWAISVLIPWLMVRKYLFIKHKFFFLNREQQLTAISCGSGTGREGMLGYRQTKGRHQSLRKGKWKWNSLNIISGKRTANYKDVGKIRSSYSGAAEEAILLGRLYCVKSEKLQTFRRLKESTKIACLLDPKGETLQPLET